MMRCDRIGGITEYGSMFFMGSDATRLADLVLGRSWSGQQISALKAGQRIFSSDSPAAWEIHRNPISGGSNGCGFGARCHCLLQGAP